VTEEAGARRIAANTLYRAAGDLGSKVATISLFVVMARKLGDAQFGIFTFGLSLVTLVTVLADFGQNSVLVREVARDRSQVHRYFVNNVALQIVLAVPALALAVAIVVLDGKDAETRAVVTLLGVAVVAELLRGTCFAVFEAHERFVYIPIALITQRLVANAIAIAALLSGAGVVTVAAIYLGGAVLAFLIALGLMFRYVVRPRLRIDPRIWGSLMRMAIPLGLAGVFGTILFRVDTAMLVLYEPKAVVGNYGAAYRLFEATLFLGWASGAAFYPVYSRLDHAALGRVFERSIKLVAAISFPVGVTASVLAHPAIDLFYGSGYGQAVGALRLLGPAIAFYGVAFLSGLLLASQRRQRVLTVIMGVAAIENILGNLVLIPRFSLDGAAVGTSISQVLVAVPLLMACSAAVGGINWIRMLVGPAIASAVAAGVMVALVAMPLPALFVAALAYLLVLVAFERLFFRDDLQGMIELLRRPPDGPVPHEFAPSSHPDL
jgi:O-antigen/teichoic acid export membrane protein